MSCVQVRSQGKPTLLLAIALTLALFLPAGAAGQEKAAPAAPEPASAAQAAPGSEFKWSWGNTVSYGLGYRLNDPDQRLIGIAAGGTAYSVNGDDGIQNYKKGIFTNAVKLTSELQFSYKGAASASTTTRTRPPTGPGHRSRTTPRSVSAAGSSSATPSCTADSSSEGGRASCAPAGR
jgi:hypothetical protein